MISKSRTGFTSPSICVTSSSSNTPESQEENIEMENYLFLNDNLLQRWKIASQALMCERNAFPSPWPSEAPFTRPAMSTTFRKAGTLLKERKQWLFKLKKVWFRSRATKTSFNRRY